MGAGYLYFNPLYELLPTTAFNSLPRIRETYVAAGRGSVSAYQGSESYDFTFKLLQY